MSPRVLLAVLALGFAPVMAGADLAEYHHEDPWGLNEAALRLLVAGDERTARILLERAAVIAPDDATIAANLATLRSAQATPGPRTWSIAGSADATVPSSAPKAAVPDPAVPAAPAAPAIWPVR